MHLPVLFFTANYHLTDVTDIEHGGTEVIPRSHLFGATPPERLEDTEWESQIHYNLGRAGSVVLFNNQVWHRGGPNRSDRTRYITQVTYARRIIGHKYYPVYELPHARAHLRRRQPTPAPTPRFPAPWELRLTELPTTPAPLKEVARHCPRSRSLLRA